MFLCYHNGTTCYNLCQHVVPNSLKIRHNKLEAIETDDMTKQELSKDDRLVVRIDKETKNAFMQRVEAEGKNASEVLLGWINDYLSQEPRFLPDISQVYADVENLKKKVAFLEDEITKKSAA